MGGEFRAGVRLKRAFLAELLLLELPEKFLFGSEIVVTAVVDSTGFSHFVGVISRNHPKNPPFCLSGCATPARGLLRRRRTPARKERNSWVGGGAGSLNN